MSSSWRIGLAISFGNFLASLEYPNFRHFFTAVTLKTVVFKNTYLFGKTTCPNSKFLEIWIFAKIASSLSSFFYGCCPSPLLASFWKAGLAIYFIWQFFLARRLVNPNFQKLGYFWQVFTAVYSVVAKLQPSAMRRDYFSPRLQTYFFCGPFNQACEEIGPSLLGMSLLTAGALRTSTPG